MSKNKFNDGVNPEEIEEVQPEVVDNEVIEDIEDTDPTAEDTVEEENDAVKIASLEEQLAKEKKEYLFLMAEFDNFRKRTLKEKSEIIRNAGEQVLKGLLPIVDDFERGLKASQDAESVDSLREGMELIYKKLMKYLEQNGVKEINPEDTDFDTNLHEAISVVPVQDESLKGKILDTVEKGYVINDKVLRHAKVVVGQ
ncbi:MAG: nucleotide exchange factor GrpE [Muribaculaceae bacterium]|nr:nucleotide exchange factor GrpE [Muribaculaceae bacterium]